MLTLLFAAFGFASLTFAITRRSGSAELGFRGAATSFGILFLILPELLSSLHALSALGFLASMALVALVSVSFLRRAGLPHPLLPRLSPWLCAAVPLVAGVFAAGAISAPNNWDSMTYHLSRVAQWASRGSIDLYPTGIPYQATHPAWAEFALLPIYLGFGGDRWVFLLQFLLWIGCAVQVRWIARGIGADETASILLALSLPMGILQASSTQNDLAVAFWALHFLGALLREKNNETLLARIELGLSLGLLLSVKGTSYLFAPALAAGALLRGWRRFSFETVSVALVLALGLNLPHLLREWLVFGTPLPSGGETYALGRLTPFTWAATLAKNLALHLNAPFLWWNSMLESSLRVFHTLLGLSLSDTDLVSVRSGFSLPPLFLYEDYDGNTLFFIASLLPLLWKRARSKELLPFYVAFFLGIALFSGLRWKPWWSRLHLPLFFVLVPGATLALQKAGSRQIARGLALVLCVAALPYAFANRTRALISVGGISAAWQIPREKQYFSSRPAVAERYLDLVRELRTQGCRKVALRSDWNTYEYPLWALLGFPKESDLRIEHVGVENETKALYPPDHPLDFCATLDLRNLP